MPLFNYPSSFDTTEEAVIVSSSNPFFNKSSEAEYDSWEKNRNGSSVGEAFPADYVKLGPGAKIYFYTTEDENVLIGPKLQSEEDVTILLLEEDDDVKKYSHIKPMTYSVLKSGVLVPKQSPGKGGNLSSCKNSNKCVYQSLKPTYYVKGFKDILIPVDVLYSKSKQKKLFNCKYLERKALSEADSWRTDLKLSRLKKDRPAIDDGYEDATAGDDSKSDVSLEELPSVNSSTGCKIRESPLNLIRCEPGQQQQQEQQQSEGDLLDLSFKRRSSDEEIRPDRTCTGDVTLFLLKNDGVFRRIPSDPFLPSGLRLSYSLLNNLLFKPKFLQGSDFMLSYITGENGDLIPHSENLHKVAAEDGNAVCFMLSKNGGMFPVKEEKGENCSINYYFNGDLIHTSQQFTETYSNSTSVLIDNKKFQLFKSSDERTLFQSLGSDRMFVKPKESSAKTRQKREAFFNGYERSGPGALPPSRQIVEPPPMMRLPPSATDQNRMMEYQPPPPRTQSLLMGRQPPPFPPELPMMHAPPADRRPPDLMTSGVQGSPKIPPPHFENGLAHRGMAYPQQSESLEPHIEEPPIDPGWPNPPLRPRTDVFIFDEKGNRIRLIPEITNNNDVVIYKLTCKGNLVRYPPCKEPEFGFDIHFQLLLDEFVLVPTILNDKPFQITYVLQENGDLIPSENNVNTFRKAPGSLIYYMLGKNNVLFPVQQIIDMEGDVSFFYQDFFLLKMKDSTEKPLHFTTKGSPLFAFFNGFTMITISSKPRLNPLRGSNWKHLKPSDSVEGPVKTMYLTGPQGELIKIAPYKNKQGATVIYELDCNGIFYRSPKDKKKCIILRSYMLLKEGILLPSNDTTGYVYMMSKNGDLFPYLYPEGKIEAPLASSRKYVLCEKGILLPIKLEIIDNYICYIFRDMVLYKERVYCKSCLDRLDEEHFDLSNKKHRKSSCDIRGKEAAEKANEKDIKLFVNKDGLYVFYEKRGKILKRYPPEPVPAYLKYTMGSFQVKSDGSLHQIRYQDPNENVANLMLEPNGDLLEDTRNVNNVWFQYYVLDAKGNLISVDAKKTKKNLYFYKDGLRICRVPIPAPVELKHDVPKEEEKITPFGQDPMGLLKDPLPERTEGGQGGDSRSLYIPIPLKSVSIADSPDTCLDCADAEHRKKCEMLKDTLKQVSKGSSLPLALELELTDEIIEELKNWAAKCDKVLSRRDVSDDFKNYINNLKFLGLKKDNA